MKYRLVPRLSLSYLAASLAPLAANPIDPTPTVVSGQVDFIGLDTHGAIINQASQKAIVDYSHFNIPEGGSVQFIQPNSNAAILNRITGADPSLLNGTLTANGQVFFVNPAGVTFGANSVIRADVFMAAAGQMSNEDFLNNIQNFSLTGNIQNFGSIKTERGVGLFGQQVENTGEIVAKNGYAIVASGDEVHVRQGGTGLSVDVTDSAKATKSGTGIKNLGTVDGEKVMFSAGDAFATSIQQSGKVSARKSAKIQSDGGAVEVSGEISVRNESGKGGRIEVGGTDLGAETAPVASSTTIAETAVLDASSESGDGGHIVVYSGGHTQFDGVANATSSSGNGGFIEASGKTLDFDSMVESIILESGGHFLIDPEEITIDTNPDNPFNASSIETLLDGGTSVTVMTDSNIPGNGNINVDANIQVPTNNLGNQGSLTLDADGDIIVAGGVTVENLQEDFAPGETVFDFQAGGDIILNGDVRHSGTNGETGRGSIAMTAGGEVYLNNTIIDANGGSVLIDADEVTLFNFSSSILSGLVGEDTASVDITAASEVNFAGGNIQTFGGADVFIDTALLANNTGSTAIARTDLAESFFGIRLPNPEDNGSGINHIYGGIQSGARALFNVTDFGPVKAGGISGNQYYYNFQPTVGITAKDGSKIYGNTFNLPTGGAAVDVATGNFVPVPLGDPFLADTSANALDLSGVTTTSAGAVTTADVGDYDITAAGATSNNGYSFDYTPGTLTVDPRAITLTASEQDKQYGDILTLDNTAFSVTDLDLDSTLPNGDTVNTLTLVSNTGVDSSTTTGATTYGDEISITGQSGNAEFNANNYDITYETGDLVVDPRNVTVTASEQEKFYGDVLDLASNASETSFTIVDNGLTDSDGNSSTLPNGESIDTVSLQSVLPVDVAASTTESAQTYNNELRITGVSGDPTFDVNNYNLTFVDGNLVVARRPITLTPDAQSKEYGEVLPLGTTAFTVLDNGLTEGGDAALPNGEQIDTVTLVSTGGVAASTDADAATYTDNIGIDNNAFASADGSNGFNLDNYDVTFLTGDLTIDPRQIELIAGRQEKFYGDGLPLDNTTFTVVDQGNALDNALPNGEEVSTVTISSATGVDSSTTADASLYSNEIVIESPVTGTPGTGDGFLESNYDITFTSGDLLVKPRPITVTPTQQEKTYGDTLVLANDNTAFTVTDLDGDSALPNGETIDTVSIISRGGHDASTTSDAVTYQDDLEITAFGTGNNGFNADNYTFDFSNLSDFVINRRAAQIVASAQEKDYGDVHDLGDTAFTVIDRDGGALPNGETVNTVTLVSANGVDASTDVDAGSYAGNISVTPTSTGTPTITGSPNFNQENYTFSYGTGDFTVNQRAVTLTASQQEKIYGNTLNLDDTAFTTLDRDGGATLPNGEVVTNVTINSATGVDSSTTSSVATYSDEIIISGPVTGTDGTGDGFLESNYDITFTSGDLLVKPRPITVTPTQQEKTYGDTLVLANDNTAFTVTDLDGDSALPNGETIDTVSIISRGGHDASTTSDAVTYQDDLEITAFGTGNNGFNADNYTFDFSNLGDFVINRRAAQIVASAQEKDYGDVHDLGDTAFTVIDRDGGALPNGETVNTVTLVSANGVDASTDVDAGSYAGNISVTPTSTGTPTITGSPNFNQENYTFSYGTGDFTVNQRAVTLTASQQEKIYGNTLNLDDTAFTTLDRDGGATLPNGEVVTNVTINSATGVDSSTTSSVATYSDEIIISGPVTGTDGTGDGFLESNYDITFTSGDLLVKPRPITVTPTQQEKTYGDTLVLANDNTAFTVTDLDGDSALPNGETIDTVSIISRGGHDASTTSDAVTYQDDLEITAFGTGNNGFNADNYTFDFSNLGDFVINRRAAQIVASAQEKDYGDVHDLGDTAFTVIDRDGGALPNGETVNTVTLVSANGVDASTDVDAGSYAGNISVTPTSTGTPTITGSPNFNQENYTFSYGTGDFTVNQRAITLTASQQEKIYGNTLNLDDTAFTTLDRDGGATLPNGEVVTNVTINSATGVDSSTTSSVATYSDEIIISGPVTGTDGTGDGFLESNYDITYVSGDLAVNKRAITVTALPQSKTYGETITPDTTDFSVIDLGGGSALPNGESIDAITITSGVAGDSTANVGTYTDDLAPTDIVASSNGFDEINYDVTRVTGDFTIDQRAIVLTALDQEKIYGNSETLDDAAFTVTDTFGGGGSALPNGETVDTVVFDPTTVPGDTTASAGVYTDEVSIADQVGGSGFAASNYDISYTPGDYTINRRAIELVIAGDDRFAGAGYEIDPAAFATIDLDGDVFLPNGESIDTLNITSLTGIAEDPSSPMGLYLGELTANPASAIGSNGFSLANYDITVTPGDFKIDPYPGLPSVAQDVYLEQWLRDNIGLDLENPFSSSYAISQSLGLRLLSLDSWVKLSGARKQAVLRSLDAVPLHLQTLDLAEELIKKVK